MQYCQTKEERYQGRVLEKKSQGYLYQQKNPSTLSISSSPSFSPSRIGSKEIDTTKGLSFLEVKYHILLEYITNLSMLMYRKLNGESIQDHGAVLALIEQRTILEKMKPVEQKLKYQIDKLVRAAVVGQQEGEAQMNAEGTTNERP